MNRQNFIRITFFISVLVFNPAVADTLQFSAGNIESKINRSITQEIASVLYRRGLEERVAEERASELTDESDETFASMINNLLSNCREIGRAELLDYLANAALHRQKIALDSYDQLIHIYSSVKQSMPDSRSRARLSMVAGKNASMAV